MMKKKLGKKGIFFTILSSFLATLIISFFSSDITYPLDAGLELTEQRVLFFHDFNKDFKYSFMPNALKLATYHSLDSLTDYLEAEAYPDDFFSEAELNNYFNELMTEGNVSISGNYYGNNESKFGYWIEIIQEYIQEEFRMNIDITSIGAFTLEQTRPFYVTVSVPISFSMTDQFAIIIDSSTIYADVSINYLRDPLMFKLAPGDRYYKRILKDPVMLLADNDTMTLTNLINQYNNQTYIEHPNGTGYLFRLQGLTNASYFTGMQSLLNTSVPFEENRSYVDYIYFDEAIFNCSLGPEHALFNVTGLPNEFRLDFETVNYDYLLTPTEFDNLCEN